MDSVAGQTVPPFEVIVCDDGSTDDTLEEAARYADVELLSLPHSGIVSISRNSGVAHASGEWVAFLDADDEWTADHLELFLEVLRAESTPPFQLFGGNAVKVDSQGNESPFFTARSTHAGGLVALEDLVRIRPIITSSAIAHRRAVLDAGGFPEDSESVSAEDLDLWYRLSQAGATFFDPRVHVRYHETPQGLTKGEGGWRSRHAAIHVLGRLLEREPGVDEKRSLQEALATDRLVLAVEYMKARRPAAAAKTTLQAARGGLRPLAAVTSRALGRRVKQLYKTALVLTVGASIAVALLGLARQRGLATILGPVGLTDLSLMLSIAMPVVTLALLPMLAFAKRLNSPANDGYEASLKLSAATCIAGFVAGALVAALFAFQTTALRYPLGHRGGLIAALLFGLGTVGIGYASSTLVFRGDLRLWRKLTLAAAVAQAIIVILCATAFERRGAVWSMGLTTAVIGGVLLARPLFRSRSIKVGFPEGWIPVAVANGLVSMTLIGVEAALRQASVDLSIVTGAYFQAAISIIGAVSAGAAQYTMGRLLPVATAARDTGSHSQVWAEARAAFAVLGLFMALLCGGLALLAPQVLTLAFSSEFSAAGQLLRFVVLGEALVAISTVVTTTLLGLGKTVHWATLSILPALARISAFYVFAESQPTSRLGWAYGMGGAVAVGAAVVGYLRFSRASG